MAALAGTAKRARFTPPREPDEGSTPLSGLAVEPPNKSRIPPMFWSLVLPVQVAFCLSVCLLAVAYVVARRFGLVRLLSFVAGCLLAGVAFVPLTVVVYGVTSPFRFGRFQAADADSVRLAPVRWRLPPHATEIDMITTNHCHHVRFRIAEDKLRAWLIKLWEAEGQFSPLARSEADFGGPSTGRHDDEFKRLGMDPEAGFLLFEGPYQSNWGGPTLCYDPQTETAWQYVGYW